MRVGTGTAADCDSTMQLYHERKYERASNARYTLLQSSPGTNCGLAQAVTTRRVEITSVASAFPPAFPSPIRAHTREKIRKNGHFSTLHDMCGAPYAGHTAVKKRAHAVPHPTPQLPTPQDNSTALTLRADALHEIRRGLVGWTDHRRLEARPPWPLPQRGN